MKPHSPILALLIVSLAGLFFQAFPYPQTLGHTLYGDVTLAGKAPPSGQSLTFQITLYTASGNVVSRDQVSANGRYRFLNVKNGEYDLVIERDNVELARVRILLQEQRYTDIRRDLTLEWRPDASAESAAPASAGTVYARPQENARLFQQALQVEQAREYDKAAGLFEKLVAADPKDYEAWGELGTAQFQKGSAKEAEKSYARALEQNPGYAVALVNLGKLRYARKDFEGAIEALTKAVGAEPRRRTRISFSGNRTCRSRKDPRRW